MQPSVTLRQAQPASQTYFRSLAGHRAGSVVGRESLLVTGLLIIALRLSVSCTVVDDVVLVNSVLLITLCLFNSYTHQYNA